MRNILISYAMDFVSFLFKDEELFEEIRGVYLFGSVARGDFDPESDVDLFVESEESLEGEVRKRLDAFYQSKRYEKWEAQGIENEISLKVGRLEEWGDLRRSIISDGISLYKKYEEVPGDFKSYLLLKIDLKDLERNEKVKIWRDLYGYRQKVGEKEYESEGLIEKLEGKKIAKSCFVIPAGASPQMTDYLRERGVKYKVYEIMGRFR